MTISKLLLIPTFVVGIVFTQLSFAQSDSTNLPGLSTTRLTTPVTSSGSGVPDPTQLDATTVYTETMVEACPTSGGNGYGYYPNGAVPGDGSNVTSSDQAVQGGLVYDQTVTTDRYGTTTYSGWVLVNNLCTAIPAPPTCASGQTTTANATWNTTTHQWEGLVCASATLDSSIAFVNKAEVWCNQYHQNDGTPIDGANSDFMWFWLGTAQVLTINDPTQGQLNYSIPWQTSGGDLIYIPPVTLPSNWQTYTLSALESLMAPDLFYTIPNGNVLNNGTAVWKGLPAIYGGGCGQGGG
jgi:hypothetical protein